MTRITKKRLNSFIENTFDTKPSTIPGDEMNMCYYSKIDGSYMNRVGNETDLKFLLKKGVTEQIQSAYDGNKTVSLGFNPEENKWYGWSHRAIYGFGIGSECNKGHCHYNPGNKEDFAESALRFWGDTDMEGDTDKVNPKATEQMQDGKLGVYVEWTYDNKVPNKRMRGKISGIFNEYPEKWGKGELVAKTNGY